MDFLRRRLSDGNFLAGGLGGGGGDPPGSGTPHPQPPLLLVIAPPDTDWVKLFKGKSVHGDVELRVEQAQFSQLSLVASTHGTLSVSIDTPKGGVRRIRPDFVLVREPPLGGCTGSSPQRLLAGLGLGGVPSSDPLPALYGFAHPPCLFAQLAQLQRELGPEAFPLVPQRFCNRPRGLLTGATLPLTVMLSPSAPGVGQVRVSSPEALGVVAAAMGGARAGAFTGAGGLRGERRRLQRIGSHYGGLRWLSTGTDPPGQGEQVEPIPVTPQHRSWLDACSRLFGGVDICGVETLKGPDGRETIIQVLGSWLPLLGPGATEDQGRIVQLVLGRMRAELPPTLPQSPSLSWPRPQILAGTPHQPGCPPQQQRAPPQGAAPVSGPAARTRPPGTQPRPQAPPTSAQPRSQSPQAPPPSGQPRPQTPPTLGQPRAQAPPASGQPRPQAPPTYSQQRLHPPPTSAQPRPQVSPSSGQPRAQTPPTSGQPRPPVSPTSGQPRAQSPPTSGQARPQTPPTAGQPRAQAPPTSGQARPQTPPTSGQPRAQAPPTSGQARPQTPPTSGQPRAQAPPTSGQARPQAPSTTGQPRPQTPPVPGDPCPQTPSTSGQPRPQTSTPSGQPRARAPSTSGQPRPQPPPVAPKPTLAPKPGAAAPPPSPAPEQGGGGGPPEGLRQLRQSFASFFE